MAVAADRQGTGLGAQVLLGAIDLVRLCGASMIWANARVSALGFYQRLRFEVVGAEFTYGPMRLPHKVIVLPLQEG
jgi:predicted N-acetyltransferase YhbS